MQLIYQTDKLQLRSLMVYYCSKWRDFLMKKMIQFKKMMHLSNLTVWEIWQRGPGCQCPHYQVAKSHSCQEVIRCCCPGTILWSLGDKDSQTKDWHILWTTAEKSEHALGCCSVHQKPTRRDRTVYYVTVHSPELCLDHNVVEWYGRLKKTGRCFVCLKL